MQGSLVESTSTKPKWFFQRQDGRTQKILPAWKGSEFAWKTTVRMAKRTHFFPLLFLWRDSPTKSNMLGDDVFFDAQSLKVPKFKVQAAEVTHFFTNNFLLVFEAKHLWKSKSCLLDNIWEKEYTCSCTCFDPDKRGGGHVDPHWDFFLKKHRPKREFIHYKICQYVSKTLLQSTLLDVDISSNIIMASYFHTLSLFSCSF